MKPLELLGGLVIAFVLTLSHTAASSQTYPSQPIKILMPYAAGGGPDIMVRVFAKALAGNDWPSVVVENRPGGTGTIAAMATMRAEPDGYTLMAADTVSHALAVKLVENLAYDPVSDFTPITMLFTFPSLLAVPSTSPAKSVAELVELAKQKPGGLTYASQGNGSGGHVLGVLFQNAVGVPMRHVPYRGAGPAMPDLIAGRVDFIFSTRGSLQAFIDSDQLRILATSSPTRDGNIPSLSEAGFPDVNYVAWFGLVGPSNLPVTVSKTLHQRAVGALNLPLVIDAMNRNGLAPHPTTAERMREMIQSDIKRLGAVVPDILRSTN